MPNSLAQLPKSAYLLAGALCLLMLGAYLARPLMTEAPPPPAAPGLGLRFPQAETPLRQNADWTPLIQEINGVQMALVPAGCFTMGGDTPPAYEDERPAHQICFKRPFWIDRYEVTNAQYGEPSELEACRAASSESNQARNCVNWFEAKFYCENRGARLPTEAEWEYAARGPDNWVYPWGDVFVAEYTVYSGNSGGRVARVGSLSPAGDSWIGAADMAGNVWEWVSSLHLPYPYRADDGREDQTYRLDVRSLRGGSWHSEDPLHHRGAVRNHYNVPQYAGDNLGFRCAASY